MLNCLVALLVFAIIDLALVVGVGQWLHMLEEQYDID